MGPPCYDDICTPPKLEGGRRRMVRLHTVGEYEKRKLWKLLQAYLRELAPYYGEVPNAQGVYSYPYFGLYFDGHDPARHAFFVDDGTPAPAGFVLVNTPTLSHPVDHAIAEFYIRPELRRHGYGRDALNLVLRALPGRWQIRYACANTAAARFWESQTEAFAPTVTLLNNGLERALAFAVPER